MQGSPDKVFLIGGIVVFLISAYALWLVFAGAVSSLKGRLAVGIVCMGAMALGGWTALGALHH